MGRWSISSPLAVAAGADLTFTSPQRLANVTVDGGKATLSTGDRTDAPSVSSLVLSNGGRLDVANQDLLLDRTSASIDTIRRFLSLGFNAGQWNGVGGIVSSIIGSNPSAGPTLGYADGATGVSGVESDKVLVRYTIAGDATLDRTVDFNDLVPLAQNYNTSGTTFPEGDFNYDGSVDFNDLVVLAQRYNTALPAVQVPAVASAPLTPTVSAAKPYPEKWVKSVFSTTPVAKARPAPAMPKAVARPRGR